MEIFENNICSYCNALSYFGIIMNLGEFSDVTYCNVFIKVMNFEHYNQWSKKGRENRV